MNRTFKTYRFLDTNTHELNFQSSPISVGDRFFINYLSISIDGLERNVFEICGVKEYGGSVIVFSTLDVLDKRENSPMFVEEQKYSFKDSTHYSFKSMFVPVIESKLIYGLKDIEVFDLLELKKLVILEIKNMFYNTFGYHVEFSIITEPISVIDGKFNLVIKIEKVDHAKIL